MQETLAFILPLSDVSARLSLVGGKGASLARMAAAGLPIPPGFYITTAAYRHFVMEHELQEQTFGSRLRCPRCEDVLDRYLPHAPWPDHALPP